MSLEAMAFITAFPNFAKSTSSIFFSGSMPDSSRISSIDDDPMKDRDLRRLEAEKERLDRVGEITITVRAKGKRHVGRG